MNIVLNGTKKYFILTSSNGWSAFIPLLSGDQKQPTATTLLLKQPATGKFTIVGFDKLSQQGASRHLQTSEGSWLSPELVEGSKPADKKELSTSFEDYFNYRTLQTAGDKGFALP